MYEYLFMSMNIYEQVSKLQREAILSRGTTTEKARFYLVGLGPRGQGKDPVQLSRGIENPPAMRTGQRSVQRYSVAIPSEQHQTGAAIMYVIRCRV